MSTPGSHAKLARESADGRREILTVPLRKELEELPPGTVPAIYHQACRFVPEAELRPLFFG